MWLRQSTAGQEIALGEFVDSTDGDTAENGLTIANTDIKIWKHGATAEVSKNSGGATYLTSSHGRYYTVLDATDTNTLGQLEVAVHVSGALGVMRRYMVLPANVFDSLVLGTDVLTVDVTEVSGVAEDLPTATDLATVDSVADAIKAKTDQMTFTNANELDSYVKSVNGTALAGSGTSADPWRPA